MKLKLPWSEANPARPRFKLVPSIDLTFALPVLRKSRATSCPPAVTVKGVPAVVPDLERSKSSQAKVQVGSFDRSDVCVAGAAEIQGPVLPASCDGQRSSGSCAIVGNRSSRLVDLDGNRARNSNHGVAVGIINANQFARARRNQRVLRNRLGIQCRIKHAI